MGGVTSFLNQDARREVPDPTFEHIAQFVPKWEWQGDDGTYVPYDAKLALKLEKAFSKLQEASASMVELSASVTVDLTQMREVAKSGEITRRIRRKTLDEVARGLAEPTWLHQDGEVLLADVPAEHLEATLVHETFFREGGLDAQEWAVVAIQRVQNYPLREAYHFERQQMLRELRRRTTEGSPEEEGKPDLELKEVWKGGEAALLGELQERLLAHGTRTCDPTVIVQDRDGFMAEKGAERAFYGQGCYFAEFVQYAHHYSHVVAGNTAFALDEAFDAPKTGGYVAVPGFERFGSPKDKNVMPVLAKDEGVKVLDKSTPEVTFGLNVSPVLLSVLDQMAKEVEERGGLPFRQQTI